MLHKQSAASCKLLWLLVILVLNLTQTNANYVTMTVGVTNTQINTAANYSFSINRGLDPTNFQTITPTAVPLNTQIIITFPSQFLNLASTSTLPCYNSDNGLSLTCNVNSVSRLITITDYYASSSTLSNKVINLNVQNVINAYIAGASGNFFWQIVNPNGTVIDQGPSAASNVWSTSITFTSGTFQSCVATASGAYVSSYSPLTLNINPSNSISSTGQLVVLIPLSWTTDPLSSPTLQSNPTCTGVANTTGTVSCSYIQSSQQVITISGLTTSSLSSAFSVMISNILIPPTVNSSEIITIYSQWSNAIQIDKCTTVISGQTAAPFQTTSFTSNDNTTVQSSFTALMKLTISRTFYYQDSIVLTLPDEFNSAQVSSINFATFVSTQNFNTLTLSSFPSTPVTLTSNSVLSFTLTGLSNPLSTVPIYLTVSIYRNNQLYQQSILTYSAVASSISSFSIYATSYFVHNSGSASLTIVSPLTIPSNSQITVTYPSSITATNTASANILSGSLSNNMVSNGTYITYNNQIIFSNIYNSDFAGTTVLSIGDFINPPTIQPSNYPIVIADSNGYTIMTSSYLFTASTKALVSNSVSASSLKVLDTGVTYTINIQSNYGFTSVSILIPSDISIGSYYSSTCAPNYFSSCILSGNNLTFVGSLTAGSYSLSWGYTTNPNSMQSTGSFMVYTYQQGWGVQNSQGVINLAMDIPAPFSSFVLYPSSYVNNALISINMAFSLPNNSPSGKISITFPSELSITTATCSGCTVVPPYVYMNIAANTVNLSLIVSNLHNVGSFKPISSFSASLTSSAGFSSLLSTTPGWTNNLPSSFTTVVSGTNNYRGQSNNFQYQITGLSGAQAYIQISIPSTFGSLSVAPAGATLISSNLVQQPCVGTSCTFNFSLVNPTFQNNYTFLLTSYTSDAYEVSTSTSNVWTFDCQGTNCKSCLSNNSCTSCYNSSLSPNYYILNTSSSLCISLCSSGYFQVNLICTACDSNCSECVNTSKTCTSCPASYYLSKTYNICVPSCQSGFFANALSLTCDICASPCLTCTSSSTYCLSCIQSYYLLSHNCLSSCPSLYYIANPVTQNCDTCSSNCLTCSNQTTYCLSCNNSLSLYFQNNACVSNCSYNYFIVNNICTYCQSPCKVCNGAVNVCASCLLNSSTPIYYNQYCISSSACPVGHYVNNTNSSCEICPVNCTQCSSATTCSVCSSNYYLYGSSCIMSCPNTTFASYNSTTNICQTCNNCNTCSSSSNCTSCILSKYLYAGICYSTCPSGTYASGLGCSACSSNCPTCQNYTYCNSCVSSMNLYKGTCNASCPSGTYANTTQQLCLSCPPSCATCVSSSSCQTCASSYSLQNSQCVLICSKGISYNQVCYPCGLYCSICSNSTCTLCDSSYYLSSNLCSSQCPVNMLSLDNMTCVLCTQKFINCSTCTLASCLSCTYGELSNGTCHPCPVGKYTQSSVCVTCPSSCATCLNQTYCYSCISSNYLLNNMCSSSCPQNMIPNGTICSLCTDSCAVCNTTTSLCTTCSAGVYLYNNLCTSVCPNSLVVSYDFLTCVTQKVYYQQFSQAAKIIPFPFTIAAGVVIIIGLILTWFFKQMHTRTVLCGLVSIIELACWVIFLIFEYRYWSNYHSQSLYSMICVGIALLLLYLLNMVHLRFYYKYISEDLQFVRWYKKYCLSNIMILMFSTSLTFKFYRFIHSKFLGREQLSMVLSGSNRLVPFSLLGVLSLILCSGPIFTGCALSLYNSISQDQQFFMALDTAVVTGIVVLLMLMDLHHPPDYFIEEHETKYFNKKFGDQDSIKFDKGSDANPLEENVSNQNLIHIQEDQGQAIQPSTANKLKSAFLKTRDNQKLSSTSKQQSESLTNIKPAEVLNIQDQQLSEETVQDVKQKWQPKAYDHHGYLIKYDANNNPIKYDENGYRVQIDEQGVHHRYNQLGQEMILVDGQYVAIDQNGYRLKNGKRYDERGYEVRQQNGTIAFYESHGFRVIKEGDQQRLVDEEGNTVKIDEDGTVHRYQQDGLQIVDYKGKKLLMDKDGNYVKKDKDGNWRPYDPQDGFFLKKNSITAQIQKYDELGYRVVVDQFGNMHRYDQDGFQVTVLPGGLVVRHDHRGYRIEKDQLGNIHRYDKDGYEVITDQNGNIHFIDQNGYTVQRDLYGRVTLFDKDGYLVIIDQETGRHRRFTEEGLEVFRDNKGNIILKDKRGRIVKQLEGETYQKYDQQGNKIYLDEQGYQVEQDEQGNIVRFDKIGDRVETDQDIQQSDDQFFESTLVAGNKKSKPSKYKYKPTQQIDHQKELNKLISNNQFLVFDQEQSEISELREFHDYVQPVKQVEVEQELTKIVNRQRDELVFLQQTDQFIQIENLDAIKNTCYDRIAEPPNQQLTGLQQTAQNEQAALADKQLNKQTQFDNQLIIAQQGVETPEIAQIGLYSAQNSLLNKELNNQPEFDRQTLVRQIDDNEPDVLAIKRQNEQIQAQQQALEHPLAPPSQQQHIQIKSVADISINERSFDNQGVQPLQNRTDFDEINSLDEMMDIPIGRNKRGGRSEMSLANPKKDTQTVYNFNTVEVQIKNNNQNLYDQDEEIESLHQDNWHEQLNPMQFARKQRVKDEANSSNANTHILYLEDDQDNKDTLSQFVNNSESGSKIKAHRYQNNDMLSGKVQSIEEVEEQLFEQINSKGIRQRREFKLSGAPNPLVEYAKTIEANKKSLQQKMYLDQLYK